MVAKRRRKKMTKTGRYNIEPRRGRKGYFIGTLIKTINLGGRRLAIFSVPKGKL